MTDIETPNESLEAIAQKIVESSNAADDKTLEAAKLIGEARHRVEAGEADSTSWAVWCKANLTLSSSRIHELCRIANADDPAAELERIREETRDRVRKCRENAKKRAEAEAEPEAPLRNGDDDQATPQTEEDAPPTADDTVADESLASSAPESESTAADNVADENSATTNDPRAQLITWASEAALEDIERVLSLIASMDHQVSGLDQAA